MRKFQRFLSIPVLGVFLLMGFVYYVTVFVFIEDWVGLRSSAGALNALIFSFLASLCIFSFSVCVVTDPGYVPSSYVPDVEDSGISGQEPTKNGAAMRHCDKCSAYKPPRTHHCRVCRRCILRMDHHCLWIDNCVGHLNYKAYFVFILYVTLGSIYSTVMIIIFAFQKNSDYYSGRIYMKVFLYYEGVRAAWLARKSGQSYRHPFDHGVYKNISLVLGPNMLKWLCPTEINHLKDGISFPTLRDSS
ncbi:probable protein S-acyltransferase 15 isoform X2 [Carica papaya]|uniref:probable protein S-acyltransferase 15 isoform X2 n=1 Tax=Carica papaya TaxID=3649 RepID=UPI000B8CC98D|nr:probable protein S-acyltransferase 15 isoform X2 [Carica papaya]